MAACAKATVRSRSRRSVACQRRNPGRPLEAAEQVGGEDGIVGYLVVQALANPAAFMSLLGRVLPMTIADTGRNGETKFVVEKHVVWPKDKDGNIIKPSWWVDEQKPSWWGDEQKKKSSTV